jgi:hypothetical protein
MSAVVQYLCRRFCFTAVCVRKTDGSYEATLSRRMPGLAQGTEHRRPQSATPDADEHFTSLTQSGALSACKDRILELDGEILGEIATDEANN